MASDPIFDAIYNGQPQVAGKVPGEQYTEIQIGDTTVPPDSDRYLHTGLQVNFGSDSKRVGGFERGQLCAVCGQMFKESEMVKIGSRWFCTENGDAQDEIAARGSN